MFYILLLLSFGFAIGNANIQNLFRSIKKECISFSFIFAFGLKKATRQ